MSGDWIKFDHATPDKPEIWRMSTLLKMPPEQVMGHLLRVWIWVDQNGRNALRNAHVDAHVDATALHVDAIARANGFSDAMIDVGWLAVDNSDPGHLWFPNLGEYISEPAKKRALNARRQQRWRNDKRNALRNAGVDGAALPEKRREDVTTALTHSQANGDRVQSTLEPPNPRSSRQRGTNPRAKGTNPRATGTNPLALKGNGQSPHGYLTDDAIKVLGMRYGIEARAGEAMDSYRARVLAEDTRQHSE